LPTKREDGHIHEYDNQQREYDRRGNWAGSERQSHDDRGWRERCSEAKPEIRPKTTLNDGKQAYKRRIKGEYAQNTHLGHLWRAEGAGDWAAERQSAVVSGRRAGAAVAFCAEQQRPKREAT